MHRSNRTISKQNNLSRKAQITLPSHLHKEEALKDPSSLLFCKKNRTTERQKTLSQTTKSISFKSTNKTLLGSSCGQSPNINKLLLELRESKASLQISSKSHKSYPCKIQRSKINRPQAECDHQRINKLVKIEKTINKLDLAALFTTEFSQMALPSASSISLRQQERTPLIEIQQEDINLQELRMYCYNQDVKDIQFKLNNHQMIGEEIAASKIQRAWRKYRTRMIITRYAHFISSRLSDSKSSQERVEFFSCPNQSEIILSSEDLFDNINERRNNQQISDLTGDFRDSKKSHYDQEIERIRRKQVERWGEVIGILNSINRKDPTEIKQLFNQILLKYEQNKKDLTQGLIEQLNTEEPLQSFGQYQYKVPIKAADQNEGAIMKQESLQAHQMPSPQSKSQNSLEMEEYNYRKYVRNFDCDSYPSGQKEQQGLISLFTKSLPQKCNISKLKQDQLLKNFFFNETSKTDSILSQIASLSNFKHRRQVSDTSHRMASAQLISIRRALSVENITHFPLQKRNNQTITQQKAPLLHQSAQLGQQQAAIKEQMPLLEKPGHLLQLYSSQGSRPLPPFFKLNNIEQQQLLPEDCEEQGDAFVNAAYRQMDFDEQKVRQIAVLVLNTLTLQTLKDISRSELITRHFKKLARLSRLQIRKSKSGRKKGFPTDKKEIESFLESIIGYIQTYEPAVFLNLQVPTGPSALEMLRFMYQEQGEESFSVCENSSNQASLMVIPNRIFQLFWQLKEKSIIVEAPESFDRSDMALFKQNLDYLKSFNKIFYRSLFDTFNQCLDYHRNFGRFGKPFPWKKTPNFPHNIMDVQIRVEVSQARKQMIEAATAYCGLIIDKEEMEELCGSEEYVAQLQEDRLSRMLTSDLVESEHRWTFYDDEETELLIELSSFAASCLVLELISQIYSLQLMRRITQQ